MDNKIRNVRIYTEIPCIYVHLLSDKEEINAHYVCLHIRCVSCKER